MTTPSNPAVDRDITTLVPVDLNVLFGSPPVAYRIPGDMPMDCYLHALAAYDDDVSEVESTKHLHACLFKLFTWYLADTEENKAAREEVNQQVRKLGVRTMLTLINNIYRDEDEGKPVEEATPPPSGTTPTTTGAPSTSSSPTPLPTPDAVQGEAGPTL